MAVFGPSACWLGYSSAVSGWFRCVGMLRKHSPCNGESPDESWRQNKRPFRRFFFVNLSEVFGIIHSGISYAVSILNIIYILYIFNRHIYIYTYQYTYVHAQTHTYMGTT